MASSGYARNIVGPGVGDNPQRAVVAFGAITGTTAATANTALTLTRDQYALRVINTTDVDLVLTIRRLGSVAADAVDLDLFRAGTAEIRDGLANFDKIPSGAIIGVYRRSGAPTSGELLVSAW